ncbi:MAG: aminotransferase class I/II-fold pyridoxal phosphate-dependent enzyme [Tissierellia bacterium]|jgi:lysine decarboxylase|nr:aminotransferase class I/II-fold pyridoxal phosphate-dependent enzyme [Tissierellia bacterium]MDD3226452.1 aminotransferase class I/II-fold pyridoxal phosphate-dependent enzyme [Tissierellia bacterium]MDD3750772.1 aminotransferase class I/II-fold pyridoxal phosphate-dependent enzyme [Tissierellia bacterium]MDD4046849.1 aminotransferase class I/II-fold pyridoxal phosphate-dependent enzyme [Tissierellia bacterium]MDD4678328.1 aminotransferase class I/II-fold pyridoxal phosphate-dependent enzym
MEKLNIISGIKQYRSEVDTNFHMPGHKGKDNILGEMSENLNFYDITETLGTDNLHYPTGFLKDAMTYISKVYGSKKSYMVVNGTSCGIISAIMACTNPGDKILVQRDCHKSVYNACILGDLKLFYLYPEFNKKYGLNFSISLDKLDQMLTDNQDIKMVVLTYPTFYGICFDVKKAVEIVHKHGKILMIDEAHGSHLHFCKELLPPSAESSGADIVTQSTHKTMPCLTQGSILHIFSDRVNVNNIDTMLRMLQTTSPSYILMASIENAVHWMDEHGEERLKRNIEVFKRRTLELRNLGINVLEDDFLISEGLYDFDATRAVISMSELGITGTELQDILRYKYKIQMEFADLQYTVGYVTATDEPEDIDRLFDAVKEIYIEESKSKEKREIIQIEAFPQLQHERKMRKAFYAENTLLNMDDAIGKTAAEFIIPYPPGIPLVCPGEIIVQDTIDYVKVMLENGINVNGVNKNNQVRVVKWKEDL